MCWYDGLGWVCMLVDRVGLGEEKVTRVRLWCIVTEKSFFLSIYVMFTVRFAVAKLYSYSFWS